MHSARRRLPPALALLALLAALPPPAAAETIAVTLSAYNPGPFPMRSWENTIISYDFTVTDGTTAIIPWNSYTGLGTLYDAGAITKLGGGTLFMSGGNAYTGGTTLNEGTLAFNSNGSIGSGTLTINGGKLSIFPTLDTFDYTLDTGAARTLFMPVTLNGSFTLGRLITLAGPITLGNDITLTTANATANVAGSSALTGVISGNHRLTFQQGTNAADSIILTAANTYTGGTAINGARIQFNSLANFGTGSVTLNGGALRWASGNTADISARLAPLGPSGAIFDTNGNDVTLATALTGTGGLVKTGAGTLTLSASNTYAGDTTLDTGTLVAAVTGSKGTFATGTTVTVNPAATLVVNGDSLGWGSGAAKLVVNGGTVSSSSTSDGHTTLRDVTMTGGRLTTSGTGRYLLNGPLVTHAATTTALIDTRLELLANPDNPTAFTIATGTTPSGIDLDLTGLVHGSGALVKNGTGTLRLTADNTYAGGTTINAGTLVLGAGGNTGSLTGNIVNHSALVFNRSDSFTHAGNISGTGTVTKNGAGTLTLTGANTHTGATTVSNGTLQIGSGGATGSLTGPIVNQAALVFNRSDNLAHTGVISGSGTVTKNGAGTLTLSGVNTYTGATTLNTGSLALGSGQALGSGTLTINGGSLLADGAPRTLANAITLAENFTLGRSLTLAGPVTLAKDITLTSANPSAAAPATSTISGVISGSHGLTLADGANPTGTLVLAAANTFTGPTTLQGGALTLAHSLALQSSTFTNTGGTLSFGTLAAATFGGLSGSANLALANASSAAVTLTIGNNNAATTYSGAFSGTGALVKQGAGTLTLTGASTHTGGTTVRAGLIDFATAASLGSGTVTLNGGGLRWAAGNTTDLSARLAAIGSSGATFDTNGNNITFTHSLSGTGGLTKTGAGTLALAAASINYTGPIRVAGGTLRLETASGFSTPTTLFLNNGATLELAGPTPTFNFNFTGLGTASDRLVGNITAGTILNLGNTYLQSGTYANNWIGESATGRLWIGGGYGNVTLNGVNDAVYTTDHNQVIIGHNVTGGAGVVKLGNALALAAATENVEVWRGTLDLNGQTAVRANSINLKDGFYSSLVNNDTGRAASYAGPVSLSGAGNYLGGDGDLTLTGLLTGSGLLKSGLGTLTLADDRFFSASGQPRSLYLYNGVLAFGGGGATAYDFGGNDGTGFTTYFSNGVLRFTGASPAVITGGHYNDEWYYEENYGGMRFDIVGPGLALADAFIYGLTLVKTGAGALTLADTGAGYYYYEDTHIREGTLALTKSGQLGSATLTIGRADHSTSGTLDLGGTTQTLSGDLRLHTGTITHGTLATGGSLHVTGDATLDATLTGTGAATVTSGLFRVNGTLANATLAVATGATLGGSGRIDAATTLHSGARLAPGNSPGTLTFTNGLALADGAILDFELGTASDLIRITGGTFSGPLDGTITVNLTDSGGFTAGTYTLFDATGATLESIGATSFVLGDSIDGYTYTFSQSDHLFLLTASAVPEPATFAALAGLWAFALAALRRRR